MNDETRQFVRQRAYFSCEYCGVSETDVGGELTIDHFQPQSKNGSDETENLVYACVRCNLYKSDYFPENLRINIFGIRVLKHLPIILSSCQAANFTRFRKREDLPSNF